MRWSLVPRMIALAVVVLAGVYYIGNRVLGFRVGPSPFTVSVDLARAGGIYTGADVTYRGVPVGKVTALDLTKTGVIVKLAINHGEQIPAQTTANVRELSALGEQYMDLVPKSSSGVYLRNGSVIPGADATIPTQVGQTLSDVAALVKGINPADIQTLEAFLYPGFANTAPDLRTIVVTGQALANALINAAPGTIQLVIDGNTVLDAALATNDQFKNFNQSLDTLTGTFASSDANLKALLDNGAAAVNQLNPLLTQDSQSIGGFVSNFAKAGSVSLAYQPAVQAMFSVLPVVSGQLGSLTSGGQIRGELTINTDETVCPYVPSSQQPPPWVRTGNPSLTNTCHTTAPDLLQRGAQNAPVVP